jgi:two-component system OmpR family response regulator
MLEAEAPIRTFLDTIQCEMAVQDIVGYVSPMESPRVLLIEDEEPLAVSIREGLVAEEFSVDVAFSGTDGLKAAETSDFDLIVVDLLLPGVNGYEICRQLRRGNVTTPIIVLTAKQGEYDESEALEMGADDFLRKPFSFTVLVARLQALLRRRRWQTSPSLTMGRLTVNQANDTCSKDGQIIDLTRTELSLLSYLMNNSNRVISKSELLANIWSNDDSDSNVVEVYIGYLRRKIDTAGQSSFIKTIRGVGYRLNLEPQ